MTDLLTRLRDCIEQNERAAPNEPWLPLMREALAEIERTSTDAARYRWLRKHRHDENQTPSVSYLIDCVGNTALDAAIDDALSAKEKP